ncbi:DUF1338 family protein [Salmonella enterica subsp. enterica]|nr:DUF1338 family protein [Salmonella enterica subsp. enterica]
MPVSYYDLSQAGVPALRHFVPIDELRSRVIPFACSLRCTHGARENAALRQQAAEILSQRDIFTSRCRQLLHGQITTSRAV